MDTGTSSLQMQSSWWEYLKGIKTEDTPNQVLMKTWQGKATGYNVPEFGWRIALDHKFRDHPISWSLPPLTQVPSVVGLGIRYLIYYKQLHQKNKKPCMDFFNQIPLHQIYGVPLGGIGSGSINRGWHGGFCKWQLKPGVYTYDCPPADQFLVTIFRPKQPVFQLVLNPKFSHSEGLSSWKRCVQGSYAFYHGLYPRAWTVYDISSHKVVLTCRQVSPVFPHDYKDTSLPTTVFVWTIENNNDEDDVEVTISLSMENGTGNRQERKTTQNLWNESFTSNLHGSLVKGVQMHNTTYPHMPYSLVIAAPEKIEYHPLTLLKLQSNQKQLVYMSLGHLQEHNNVSHCVSFNPTKNGSEVWEPLKTKGQLESNLDRSHMTEKGEPIACAVASRCKIAAKSKNEVEFCLAWNMPKVHFGDSARYYKRRYTRWFDSKNEPAGPRLADYSLHKYQFWETKIEEWQAPILLCRYLPDWYKSAIFNELYYITDGGTIWVESESVEECETHAQENSEKRNSNVNGLRELSREEEIRNCKHILEYGRFAYLEGQEYKMYNTYDVHFYASIALAHLWPQLELSLQYDIAAGILHGNPEERKYLMDGTIAPIKTPNCVPHDVGCPDDEPWLSVNAYFVHDTADWRDLNPKFVLQVYRDYHLTQDKQFLAMLWPVLKRVMEHSIKHDEDGDGLIENSGAADQTFDGWCVQGPSAYCGGLWLAALRSMVEAAQVLDHGEDKQKYLDILHRAAKAYDKCLWNGKYFNYDSSRHNRSNSIMADQCAGVWYLAESGIDDVISDEKVLKTLNTIFEFNVKKYDNGHHGAVNGMRPTGAVDPCSVQSVEVWTGVTYALAATMIHKGMIEEAFETASGVYYTCWERYGMAFQTPEAFRKNRTYRSLAYMRPLSIWGMQYAIENLQNKTEVTDQSI